MKVDELDVIEHVYEVKIKNKEALAKEIIKKSEESGYDVLQLCTVVNSWIAQSHSSGDVEVPLEIIKDIK